FYGKATSALLQMAQTLESYLPAMMIVLLSCVIAVLWSLPNLTGFVRRGLDRVFIWRLYRDFQGIRFMALLSTMVRQRQNVGSRLRDAILAQQVSACAWKSWHLDRMVVLLDDGVVGADTFQTGLLDNVTRWFLADMIA